MSSRRILSRELETILPGTVPQRARPNLQHPAKTCQISPYHLGRDALLSLQDKRKKRRIDDPQLSTAADTCRIPGTEPSDCKVQSPSVRLAKWTEDQKLDRRPGRSRRLAIRQLGSSSPACHITNCRNPAELLEEYSNTLRT
jgi:hypothetical protein